MSSVIHEVDFSSQVASWINQIAINNGVQFPIAEARIETLSKGSRSRRDLTLYDHHKTPVLTCEIKLPWSIDGHSPYFEDVVDDARRKAQKAGVKWFVTWNVNELLLWNLAEAGTLGESRAVERYVIANVQQRTDLDNPRIIDSIRDNIERFVQIFARTLKGERGIDKRSPDIYFIHSLESFLERPIQLTRLDLLRRYERPKERERLNMWMRDRQGWSIVDDEDELLLRAAQFTNFTVANRLIFYEALRKRFVALRQLNIPIHITEAERLFDHMRAFFDEARHITGDYETIFGVDPNDIGDRTPFYEDLTVESWRRLTQHVHRFDFSRLDYDVVGQIFEGLIGPEERHKYGQYYTRPEIVDVINAFCIRNGGDTVMDPGCGGGTFLVRAYARKRHLSPRLEHLDLLRGIYGVDISRFATHLSTMNLAARDLVEAQNYPRVARSDFFDLGPDRTFMALPSGTGNDIDLRASNLDAVVGNPPYVRQEDIPKEKKDEYRRLVKDSVQLEANGRSDLHVFFWGHAASFLKQQGWLGFLTSSQWLDVEYGFPLQHFLLERFRVVAIIESRIEPWFVGARVQTAATIAQLDNNADVRNDNVVRFVEVRRPLAEVLGFDGTSAGSISAADEFRNLVLRTTVDETTDAYRIRCVPQRDLLNDGLRNGEILRGRREYAGGKWGIPLRAPGLWAELRTATETRWRRFGELAEIRFGVKTGVDKFFYVDDVSGPALRDLSDPHAFERHYRVGRDEVASGRLKVIKNGYGEVHPVEARYLEPVVHSLMHIDEYVVSNAHCEHLVIMCGEPREALNDTYIENYLRRGEEQSVHTGATVAARVSENRTWYDLTNARRVGLLWAKSHQYRHCVPLNPERYVANCNLYTVDTEGDVEVVAAILNSSVVLLAKHLYGRPVGVESNLKTEIVDVNMMPVPDWTQANARIVRRLRSGFASLSGRKVLGVLSERRLRRQKFLEQGISDQLERLSDLTEFEQPDRREIDDAVLELLGVGDATARHLMRDRLYIYLREYFENARRKEERAIDNKKTVKRRNKLTPQSLAGDVFADIEKTSPLLLRRYSDLSREDGDIPVEGVRIPSHTRAEIVDDMLTTGVRFTRGKGKGEIVRTRSADQARLVLKIAEMGEAGRSHFVPVEIDFIKRHLRRIEGHIKRRRDRAHELINERTNDLELQAKALAMVLARF